MRYPVVNAPAVSGRSMGQAAAPDVAELSALREARLVAARVAAAHPRLVASIGEANALRALDEARAALDRAEEAYAYASGVPLEEAGRVL